MGFLDYKGLERFLKNSREEFAQKSHTHDERYYTEYEIDNKLSKKSDVNHIHDDRYYTEAEVDGKLEGKSSTDHTHDLSELISALSIGTSTTLNDAVQIITQDTDTANQKYYRRPLTVLWNYIKSKADSVYSAIGHNHKIQNLEDYTTRVYDATIVRPADTVLASPQDKDGIATFRKLDKNDVGLENVDNTADVDKNVATARGISVGDPVLATGLENSEITGKMNDNKSLGTTAANAGVWGLRNALDFRWYDTHWQIGNLRSGSTPSAGFGFAFKDEGENSFSLKARILTDGTYEGNISGNAATAGTANTLSGFSPRSSQTWGVQTGTFVHGEGDSTGGDFAFRKDCPNAGQVSMVLDGRFYQNEGQYMCLDTNNYSSYALPLTGGTISGAVTANTYYAPNWFRATGDSGFYFENHGGGWYMIDDTWIRAYNNKNIYTPGVIQCDSGFNGNLNGNVNGTINGIQVKSGYNVSTNFPNQVCTELGVDSGNHNFLATLRCSQGNNSGMPQHGSGAVWGCGDTQGYIYTSYYGPEVWIGGGNANKFVWQKQLAFLDSKVSSSGYADSAGSATALNMNSAGNGNSIYGSGNDAVNGPGGGLNNVVISSWYGVSFTSPCGVGYGGKNQTAVGIDCREGIVKAARFDGYLNGTATNAEYLGNDAAYMRMHWNGQGGQPTWLWGGNDASNMYVWNPSNFSVNYANSAGNGVVASGSNYVRFGDGTQICWGQQGIANAGTTITFAVAFSSIPAVVNSGTEDIDDVFFVRNITTTNFVADKIGWFSGNNTWIAIGRWK